MPLLMYRAGGLNIRFEGPDQSGILTDQHVQHNFFNQNLDCDTGFQIRVLFMDSPVLFTKT
jgi:hypothetical protein